MRRPRVGLLGISGDRAAPEIVAQRSHFVEHVGRRLAARIEVVLSGAIFPSDQAQAGVRALVERRVAGVACLMLSGGPTAGLASALAAARLPLLVANVQPERTVGEDWTSADLVFNQGVRGAQDLAHALTRAGVPFTAATGDWMSDRFAGAVESWATAAQAARKGTSAAARRSTRPGAATLSSSDPAHEVLLRAAATISADAVICHMQAMDWNRDAVLIAPASDHPSPAPLPAEGPATTVAVAPSGEGSRRLVVGRGEILGGCARSIGAAPSCHLAPTGGLDGFLDTWLTLGAAAQFVATSGDRREHWRSVAELLDTEYEEIR